MSTKKHLWHAGLSINKHIIISLGPFSTGVTLFRLQHIQVPSLHLKLISTNQI